MFFSKSNFFFQSVERLKYFRNNVLTLLNLKEIDAAKFLKAYDYFVINPSDFDGATIVKDLQDLPRLDLSALVHDYEYIVNLKKYKGLEWLKYKVKIDFKYGKDMEALGKGIYHYIRVVGLILSTPFYWLMIKFKK